MNLQASLLGVNVTVTLGLSALVLTPYRRYTPHFETLKLMNASLVFLASSFLTMFIWKQILLISLESRLQSQACLSDCGLGFRLLSKAAPLQCPDAAWSTGNSTVAVKLSVVSARTSK